MGYVFISYSRVDNAYAHNLANEPRRHGLDVWIDDRIEHGERWWQTIVSAIHACSAFVVVMSPDSEKSEWVEREILLAQRENKPLFPLLLRGREFPLLITSQFVNVANGQPPPKDFFETLQPIVGFHSGTGRLLTPPKPKKSKIPKALRKAPPPPMVMPQAVPYVMVAPPPTKKRRACGCGCAWKMLVVMGILMVVSGVAYGGDRTISACEGRTGVLFAASTQNWTLYAEDGDNLSLSVNNGLLDIESVRVYLPDGTLFFESWPEWIGGTLFEGVFMPYTGDYRIEITGSTFAIYEVVIGGGTCD